MPLPDDLHREQEEALKSAEVFSFDIERLKLQIYSGDLLTTVIKAHLYLEHVLIFFLRECFARPDEVNLRRVSFPTKVDLCVALGLIDKDLRSPLNKVNEMRNRVAHNLEFEVDNVARQEFWMSLPHHLRQARLEDLGIAEDDYLKIQFPQIFDVLIYWLDICRQRYVQGKIKSDFAHRHLQRALGRASPALTKSAQLKADDGV